MLVLLADGSNESACGCESLLREVNADATIFHARCLRDTLPVARAHPQLDLIVWHASRQTDEDFRLVRNLADMAVGIPIVVFAKQAGAVQVAMAMQAGINGYVLLPTQRALIIEILRLVVSGGTYFPASLLTDRVREEVAFGGERNVKIKSPRSLTPRQQEVLELVIEGRTNREIAGTLGIAEATAKLHVSALLRAMNVRTRDEAIQRARSAIALAS